MKFRLNFICFTVALTFFSPLPSFANEAAAKPCSPRSVLKTIFSAPKRFRGAFPRTYRRIRRTALWIGIPEAGWTLLEVTNRSKKENPEWPNAYRYAKHPASEPLSSRDLGRSLADVIYASGKPIDDFERFHANYIAYLAGSRDVDYTTGREAELKSWILAQPENSVTIESLLEKSLELNSSISNGILCVHELLRNEARVGESYIRYQTTTEERTRLFNKLVDVRGDLVEAGGDGDHAGSWYRMFGMLLKVYADGVTSNPTDERKTRIEAEKLEWNYASEVVVATGAEMIKPIVRWPERDLGKASFNRFAVSTGYFMLKTLVEDQKAYKLAP